MADAVSSVALWDASQERTLGLGKRVALSTRHGEVTFGALWREAELFANAFVKAGVAEGTTVGLALPNSRWFVSTFLALCKLGGIVALVPPQYRAGELRALAQGVPLQSVVTTSELAPRIASALQSSSSSLADGLEVLVRKDSPESGSNSQGAVLKFSSGSTGEPKGILLTAANLIAEADNVTRTLEVGSRDRILAGVPLFHSYGFDLAVLATLHAGSCLVLEDVFVPRRTLAMLDGSDITVFLGVPAQYRLLVSTSMSSPPDLSGVRWLLSCTAPLGTETIIRFRDRFGGIVCQHYGSSETGAVTTHLPSEVLRRPASVGRPMVGVDVRIVDSAGKVVPRGEEGEVVVASAALARGYVMGGPRGLSPFRGREYWTGDVGLLDDEGFLTLLGRKDSVINVGGFKVSPVEVAEVIERHEAVREALVLGVRDGKGEEVVYALVEASGKVTEAELLALCRTALADYKVPRRIEIRKSLPRTGSGKARLRPEGFAR